MISLARRVLLRRDGHCGVTAAAVVLALIAPAGVTSASSASVPDFMPMTLDDREGLTPELVLEMSSQRYRSGVREELYVTVTEASGAMRRSTVGLHIEPVAGARVQYAPFRLELGNLLVTGCGGTVRAINKRDGLYYAEWACGEDDADRSKPCPSLVDILPPLPLPQLGLARNEIWADGQPGSLSMAPNIVWMSVTRPRGEGWIQLEGEGDAGRATMLFDPEFRLFSFESEAMGGGKVRVLSSILEYPVTSPVRCIDTAGRVRVPTLARLTPREGPASVGQRCPPFLISPLRMWSDNADEAGDTHGWSSDDEHRSSTLVILVRSQVWDALAARVVGLAERAVGLAERALGASSADAGAATKPAGGIVSPRAIVVAVRELADLATDQDVIERVGREVDRRRVMLGRSRSASTTIDRFDPAAAAIAVVVDRDGVIALVEALGVEAMEAADDEPGDDALGAIVSRLASAMTSRVGIGVDTGIPQTPGRGE